MDYGFERLVQPASARRKFRAGSNWNPPHSHGVRDGRTGGAEESCPSLIHTCPIEQDGSFHLSVPTFLQKITSQNGTIIPNAIFVPEHAGSCENSADFGKKSVIKNC